MSTDSDRIAAEGLAEGGEVIPRPQELASDTADVVDVIDQVLGVLRLEGFVPSSVTLLEPSSPLRTVEIVKRTVAELRFSDAAFTVSPVPSRFHARKQFSLDRESIARPTVSETPPPVRRQELAPTFIKNGAAYAFRTESFLRCRSVLGAAPRAVLIAEPIVNIDTLADLAAAARHLGDG